MAWLDNIRNAMHPYDDDYIENEERAAEDEFSRQEDDIPADESFEDKQPRPVFSRREPKQQPSYSAPAQEKQKMKLKFVHPEQFDEAAEIADSLRAHQAVLMNLEATETDTARRLLDFLSGAARVMRVSAQAYIIAPTNVDLVGDAVADFESAGLYF